ncbi:Retrovirus-related Pol polyprotein from transposon opus, partial [Mucuna pruriens]
MEVFMDDFIVYAESFEACLENLSRVLTRSIEMNLVLNFEKFLFMVTEGIVLRHLLSSRGIEVDKAKVDIITSLSNPASMRELCSILEHAEFQQDCPAFVQATSERYGLCLRLALHGGFLGVEEATWLRSYLLGSKIIIFSDHVVLKVFLKKPDAKLRLIQWMLLLYKFDMQIRDKKGAENSVTDHLSRIERGIDPSSIQDDFPNEWTRMNHDLPIYAIFSLHLRFLQHHPNLTRIKLKVMLSITYGMICIFGDSVVTKSFAGAFQITRSNQSSSSIIRHPKAATTNQVGQPRKYSTVGSIGPPFSEMLTNMSRPTNSVSE